MKQPYWKKLMSHFFAFQLEKRPSAFSGELEVLYTQGRYQLATKNAVYSYEDLYHNFRESFHQLALDELGHQPKVLLLGLGLGSVPHLLEKQFQKQWSYTAVEIDDVVIELAQKYGLKQLNSPIELVCADAYDFVFTARKQVYDLVIIDLFIDTEVPTAFEREDFLEAIRQIMKPNALIMYNRMASSPAAEEKTMHFFEKVFKKCFPDATFLRIKGNKMLLNKHQTKP